MGRVAALPMVLAFLLVGGSRSVGAALPGATGPCPGNPDLVADPLPGPGILPNAKTRPLEEGESIVVSWCVRFAVPIPHLAGFAFRVSYDANEIDLLHTRALPPYGGATPSGAPTGVHGDVSVSFPPLTPSQLVSSPPRSSPGAVARRERDQLRSCASSSTKARMPSTSRAGVRPMMRCTPSSA